MVERYKEKDSGFSIDDILHESPKSQNQLKRPNPSTSNEFEIKKDKLDENIKESDTIQYSDRTYCSTSNEPISINYGKYSDNQSQIFMQPHLVQSIPTQNVPPKTTTGFGIVDLLSSEDSFLAKSVVVHDNKSNLSHKSMTFLEKLNTSKKEKMDVNDIENDHELEMDELPIAQTNDENLVVSKTVDHYNKEENDNINPNTKVVPQNSTSNNIPITGEENEKILIDTFCKLYLFDKDNNSWNNTGMVNLHINEYIRKENDPSDKFYTRIVARSLALQRAVLNFKLWPNIIIDLPAQNSILMQAIYMDDIENIRYISLTMKPPKSYQVWKILREKASEINEFTERKSILKEYRENHHDCDHINDDELYAAITYKNPTNNTKRMQLLDSKKTYNSEDDDDDEDDEDEDDYSDDDDDGNDEDSEEDEDDDDDDDDNDEEEDMDYSSDTDIDNMVYTFNDTNEGNHDCSNGGTDSGNAISTDDENEAFIDDAYDNATDDHNITNDDGTSNSESDEGLLNFQNSGSYKKIFNDQNKVVALVYDGSSDEADKIDTSIQFLSTTSSSLHSDSNTAYGNLSSESYNTSSTNSNSSNISKDNFSNPAP